MSPVTRRAAAAAPTKRQRASLVDSTGPSRGRVRIDEHDDSEGLGASSTYFADVMQKDSLTFIRSGAAVFDAMLGGGYVTGRVVNVVGDKSAGKTLLAIEAVANFHMEFPHALKRYGESEHAFDKGYAEALGMPVDAVEFIPRGVPFRTVEDFSADLKDFCARVREHGPWPAIYVLDSLDALSDDAELARAVDDKATFGAQKAKLMSETFRRLIGDIEEANVLLIVVSQLRDKIGVTWGEKQTRSGGHALDFYASHIIWLREKGKIKQTIAKVERVIGVDVHARVKKNKVGLPFRECEYPILFGYGVDDLTANVEWLLSVGREKVLEQEFGMSKAGYKVRITNLRNKGGEGVRDIRQRLREVVFREWKNVEQGFLPKARKY